MELTRLLTRAKVLLLQGAREGAEFFIEQAMAEADKPKQELAELDTLRARVTEMAAEVERLSHERQCLAEAIGRIAVASGDTRTEFTGPDLLMACGDAAEGIKHLTAENSRLQSVIDEANTQEPDGFLSVVPLEGRPGFSTILARPLSPVLDGQRFYFRPIPEQQSPTVAVRDIWHELKTDPGVFDAVSHGYKTHEIRFNDRNFQVGDGLILRKTKHSGEEMLNGAQLIYTGEVCQKTVSHVLNGYGLKEGWVILSFAAQSPRITEQDARQWIEAAISLLDDYVPNPKPFTGIGRSLLNKLNGDQNGK